MEGEFKMIGFATKQDILEHQVKEYQLFMREQTARIESLEAKLQVAMRDIEKLFKDVDAGWTMSSRNNLLRILEKIKAK